MAVMISGAAIVDAALYPSIIVCLLRCFGDVSDVVVRPRALREHELRRRQKPFPETAPDVDVKVPRPVVSDPVRRKPREYLPGLALDPDREHVRLVTHRRRGFGELPSLTARSLDPGMRVLSGAIVNDDRVDAPDQNQTARAALMTATTANAMDA